MTLSRDYRDVVCGILLACIGLSVAYYASTHYELGNWARMGPGLSFVALGFILAALGALIAIPAFFRAGEVPKPEVRPFIAVVAAMVAFSLVLRPFGFIPAVAATSLIASFADKKLGPVGIVVLSICVSAICYGIFILGLRLSMVPFRLPV